MLKRWLRVCEWCVVQIAKLMMMDPIEIEPILFKIVGAMEPEDEVSRKPLYPIPILCPAHNRIIMPL